MVRSDLPFGSEFSPQQIDLVTVLDIAQKHDGDWKALEANVYQRYFKDYKTSEYNRRKLANNCKLALIGYGLLTREGSVTELGKELLDMKARPEKLYARFAQHILLNLKGLIVIQTTKDMHARGERFELQRLREWLGERGVHVPRGGKQMSTMRLWLEKAGVVTTTDWQVDDARLNEVLGTNLEVVDEVSVLSVEQRAFLKTLANMAGSDSYPSNDVERLASATYGVRYDEKNLPKTVLYPLQERGYIELKRGTKEEGRGAKPFRITLTEKLRKELIIPLISGIESQARPELRPLLRKSLHEILKSLSAPDRHVKGLALEALAFYLMRLIDLRYVATRLRGDATGGAEVDVIFEGERLIFSRWQIQCKNTKAVSLDDVAKEVGLTYRTRPDVVLVVGTGDISPPARSFARMMWQDCGKNVLMIEGRDLVTTARDPSKFPSLLTAQIPYVLNYA